MWGSRGRDDASGVRIKSPSAELIRGLPASARNIERRGKILRSLASPELNES
jgi:hypothetical protein